MDQSMWHSHAQAPRGGTDLERGYGDVRPWRPPFHASPAARKGPISSKRDSSQDPLLRKFGNFSLNSLNFPPNFSSQAPKFGNFQFTSPQIWKFSAYKPPNLEIFRSQAPLFRGKCQFASPTLRKSGLHTPTWNKVECPPPPGRAHTQSTMRCLGPVRGVQWIFSIHSAYLLTSQSENKKLSRSVWITASVNWNSFVPHLNIMS